MKTVVGITVATLMLTSLDIAPMGSCSDKHPHHHKEYTEEITSSLFVKNITSQSATLYGQFFISSLPPYENFKNGGFEIINVDNSDNSKNEIRQIILDEIPQNEMSVEVNELKQETKYEFRTFVSCINNHVYYGNWISFTTLKSTE